MRFVRGDVSDHTFLRKRTIEVRIDATEYCRGGVGQKSTFAEFSEWFDFHLLQHYRGEKQTSVTSDCDWPLLAAQSGHSLQAIKNASRMARGEKFISPLDQKRKAGGHYAADLVLQLPSRGSGSVALHSVLLDRFD